MRYTANWCNGRLGNSIKETQALNQGFEDRKSRIQRRVIVGESGRVSGHRQTRWVFEGSFLGVQGLDRDLNQ
jgi:hypothetical protein